MEPQENFSFQPINGGSTPITESLPLYSLALKSIDHHEKEDRGYENVDRSSEKKSNGAHRKTNCCSRDRKINEIAIDSDAEEDEKMDMLWEDFNEELLKNLSSRFGSHKLPELEDLESEEATEGGGALLSARMAGVVVIMKVLKKLLFLHSFRRKLKARTW
ncbi:unnamed protein product [Citrullus colocynthis]|uniref:Uncharacterized protein n=1 Tax=Citrullus colocynthis TaxID=252529 RepID=A0ABP0Z004_9ROSI